VFEESAGEKKLKIGQDNGEIVDSAAAFLIHGVGLPG